MIRWAYWRALAFLYARYELIPAPDGSPYMSRWHFPTWLARRYDAAFLFLQFFHQSDQDRGWHDHPWTWFKSRILRGAYLQATPYFWRGEWRQAYRVFREGDCNYITSERHTISILRRPTWTLLLAGPKHGRSWGFMDHKGRTWPANGAIQ